MDALLPLKVDQQQRRVVQIERQPNFHLDFGSEEFVFIGKREMGAECVREIGILP